MTDNKITLWGDFDTEGDNYDKMVHVRTTDHGIFRAVVERDDYPDAPDYEMACPVLEVNRSSLGMIRLGEDSYRHDGIDAGIGTVWDTMCDLVSTLR